MAMNTQIIGKELISYLQHFEEMELLYMRKITNSSPRHERPGVEFSPEDRNQYRAIIQSNFGSPKKQELEEWAKKIGDEACSQARNFLMDFQRGFDASRLGSGYSWHEYLGKQGHVGAKELWMFTYLVEKSSNTWNKITVMLRPLEVRKGMRIVFLICIVCADDKKILFEHMTSHPDFADNSVEGRAAQEFVDRFEQHDPAHKYLVIKAIPIIPAAGPAQAIDSRPIISHVVEVFDKKLTPELIENMLKS